MKKFLSIITVLLVLGGGVAWFWSLGSVPAESARSVTVRVESQGVSVREPLRAAWVPAADGMVIGEGWSVKTDENGRAAVVVADMGESRLDRNTEITLTKTSLQASGVGETVECSLAMGRLWTRVLRLFDLGSSYAVKTSAVVATVRGTSFDVAIAATGTVLSVADAAVDVVPVGGAVATSSNVIPVGMVAAYAADGRMVTKRAMTDEERNTEWASGNFRDDRDFDARVLAARSAELSALGGVPSGSALEGLSSLSERAHLALARGEDRNRLIERYAERRIARIVSLVTGGKSGQAAQEFARLENEMKASSAEGAERAAFRIALARVASLVMAADANSPLFAFRQRIETLVAAVADAGGSSGVYARLVAVEDRLDEAERFIAAGALEEAGIALNGAENGIENITRESSPLLSGFSSGDRAAIEGKIAALRARASAARARLGRAMSGIGEFTTSTPSLPPGFASTSTPPGFDQATSTDVSSSTLNVVSIRASLSPDPLPIGKTGAIRVVAVFSDGSTENISARSTVSVRDGGIAHVNGLEVTGVEEGTTTLTATYAPADGEVFTAKATVTVKGSAIPASLSLTASNGTALATGEPTLLTATVRYADGTRKIVTPNAAFVLNPDSIGELSGAAYTSSAPGSATLTASYTENGKTVTSSLLITVTEPVQVSNGSATSAE